MHSIMSENMVVNGEHEKISIGRVLVSGSTPHPFGKMGTCLFHFQAKVDTSSFSSGTMDRIPQRYDNLSNGL